MIHFINLLIYFSESPQKMAKVFQYKPSRAAVTPVELTWQVVLTDKFHQKHNTAGDALIPAPMDPMKVVFMFPHDGSNKPHKLCAWGQKVEFYFIFTYLFFIHQCDLFVFS
jgi:hypothetical protein